MFVFCDVLDVFEDILLTFLDSLCNQLHDNFVPMSFYNEALEGVMCDVRNIRVKRRDGRRSKKGNN